MAWYDVGNPPIYSTAAPSTASTVTLCAELDSTQLGTVNFATGQSGLFKVTWILGADTNAVWQCESCASTALNAGVDIFFPQTPTAASAQFVTTHTLEKDYRLRARIGGSTFNATVRALIIAERMT
jgi:hypothetical protein